MMHDWNEYQKQILATIAVTRQCDGCITIHTDAALKRGATRDESSRRWALRSPSMQGRRWSILRG